MVFDACRVHNRNYSVFSICGTFKNLWSPSLSDFFPVFPVLLRVLQGLLLVCIGNKKEKEQLVCERLVELQSLAPSSPSVSAEEKEDLNTLLLYVSP